MVIEPSSIGKPCPVALGAASRDLQVVPGLGLQHHSLHKASLTLGAAYSYIGMSTRYPWRSAAQGIPGGSTQPLATFSQCAPEQHKLQFLEFAFGLEDILRNHTGGSPKFAGIVCLC